MSATAREANPKMPQPGAQVARPSGSIASCASIAGTEGNDSQDQDQRDQFKHSGNHESGSPSLSADPGPPAPPPHFVGGNRLFARAKVYGRK